MVDIRPCSFIHPEREASYELWKAVVVSLVLILGVSSEGVAHDLGGDELIVFPLYQSSSEFTKLPAQIGAWIGAVPGAVVGGAGYIIGYGVGLPFDKENQFAINTALVPALSCTWLGSAITGAPFFIVELVLVDLPKFLFKLEETEATAQAIAARHWARPAVKKKPTALQQTPVRVEQVEFPCIPRSTVDPETGEVRLKAGHAPLQSAAGYAHTYCDEIDE
ncbi:hypothetical protein VT98_11701 [Candidatus Electrothrix communis]|uniref:Uncharacterized protein n=1 Tax=Candidatus Electrothrix communis TaxID=1859133 RepID=A0A3S3UBW9_9BACT|nr:hypothetical protein [Desulfobulbus sp. US4]RWX48285.1 hypothetical protein VT98_11701 [Candidatus Electrothrix communis]